MTEGFSRNELSKPPSPKELDKVEREIGALEVYAKASTADAGLKAVMNEYGIGRAQATVLVNRAAERFYQDRKSRAHVLYAKQSMRTEEMGDDLFAAFKDGELARAEQILKTYERLAKLHGLDEKREDEQVMPTINIVTAIPGLPPADVVIEEDQNELGATEGP